MAVKKLIEVALPLEAINAASSREKKVHKGNPSTLHLWWARRPVTATRAVLWSSLIDDPSSHPELFPDEESQTAERDRLFGILRELVKWDNTDNEEVLELARSEIRKSFNGELPLVYDPFAGGGSIPLEAQRLGMAAYASDLNPIPVMINHAMIDYPPRFASQPPVHPNAKSIGIKSKDLYLSRGLAEDVSYYGKQLEETARELLRDNYPSIHIQGLGEATPQAYIWTRTVICPNPACGCEVPLVNTFWLSKRRGKEAYVKPSYHTGMLTFSVEHGKNGVPTETKISRGTFQCPHCGATIEEEYIKAFGNDNGYGQRLMAVVAKGASGKTYVSPTAEQEECGRIEGTDECPDELLPTNPRWFSPPAYGMKQYNDLFTGRQQRALVTFSDLVKGIVPEIERDAIAAGFDDDHITLADGGRGALAYAQAIQVYLAFAVDKMVDYNSTICVWHTTRDIVANTMRRQAIQMTWDYAETNPLGGASGSFSSMLKWIVDCFRYFPSHGEANVVQQDAAVDNGLRDIVVSTDPPYYDNIGYADLSDYFYVWLRRGLRDLYPDLFSTVLVPKAEELIATPYRFGGSTSKAKTFFENGMAEVCSRLYQYSRDDVPVTVYYAFKQSEVEKTTAGEDRVSSSGWETMLAALISSGFSITGTWPIRTELTTALKGKVNALASSVVLVCRKRDGKAPNATRRDFVSSLKRELRPALDKLRTSSIAPVDLAQSAIGPGIAVYSRFSKVLEANGSEMTVRSALQIINQELDLYFSDQDNDLDRESRFCVDLYTQTAFNELRFGEADVLARAKNTSIEGIAARGALSSSKGIVRLLGRDELKDEPDPNFCWLFTQQLTYAMETGGIEACAQMIKGIYDSRAENAKALAYRLFTIADKKGWAQEAFAYNSLVVAWPDIQDRAAQLQAQEPVQYTLDLNV